jgi:uncharacterized protein (AIM24 family)
MSAGASTTANRNYPRPHSSSESPFIAQSQATLADAVDADVSGLAALLNATGADDITASATQTHAGATVISAGNNKIVTVATPGNAVRVPAATVGAQLVVQNAHATNAVNVFPTTGGQINVLAVDGAYSLIAARTAFLFCVSAGKWNLVLFA